MCLLEKSEVKFEDYQTFHGYKVFLVDRNGLLVSPFIISKKIPFRVSDTIEWKNSYIVGNAGFYSFLNCKDAEYFENIQGAGYKVHNGYFIALEVTLSKVTYFGMGCGSEACLISNRIYLKDYLKLRNFIHANRNSAYFKAGVEKIASMACWEYNEYVDSFKNYNFYEHN